jgi:hypothetical protein
MNTPPSCGGFQKVGNKKGAPFGTPIARQVHYAEIVSFFYIVGYTIMGANKVEHY